MSEINEANTVLSDPERRAAYDQLGDASQFQQGGFRPPPGWQGARAYGNFDDAGGFGQAGPHGFGHSAGSSQGFGGFGGGEHFNDSGDYSGFFEELFGRGQAFRQGGGQPRDMRGSDQHATIELTVPESYSGTTRMLALRTVELDDQGHAHERVRELEVNIPKGVREGQMIRLAGKGQPGIGKGAPGAAAAGEVRARQPLVHRGQGRVPAGLRHALAGSTGRPGRVPDAGRHLRDQRARRQPAGPQAAHSRQGLPAKEPGDLYLVLDIRVPVPDTDAQRDAYAALAKAFGNPTT